MNLATGQVSAGTVKGVLTEQWTGSAWAQHWLLEKVSVSAVSIYNAAMTAGTTDDFNLVAQALAGADLFQLSNGADHMRGYGGNDRLFGKGGNDILRGDAGNDILTGGAGQDNLYGGTGADVFDFNLAGESSTAARDVIRDFVRAQGDKINLASIDANATVTGNQAFTGFIGASRAFTAPGQLKFANGVLYGNTDGDATAEFAIAVVGVTSLAAVTDVVL